MIPWGMLKQCNDAISTFAQFALKEGWTREQITETVTDKINSNSIKDIVQAISEELQDLMM